MFHTILLPVSYLNSFPSTWLHAPSLWLPGYPDIFQTHLTLSTQKATWFILYLLWIILTFVSEICLVLKSQSCSSVLYPPLEYFLPSKCYAFCLFIACVFLLECSFRKTVILCLFIIAEAWVQVCPFTQPLPRPLKIGSLVLFRGSLWFLLLSVFNGC